MRHLFLTILFIVSISLGCTSLCSCDVASSGTSGIDCQCDESAEDVEFCPSPTVTAAVFTNSTRLLIIGNAEIGSTVRVANTNDDSVSSFCEDGTFVLNVNTSRKNETIDIYATLKGVESDKKTYNLNYPSNTGVIPGDGGYLHIAYSRNDYLGLMNYSVDEAKEKCLYLEEFQKQISKISPNTKVIFLITPNLSTVYPETMPDWMRQKKLGNSNSRRELLNRYIHDYDVAFVDVSDALLSKKNDGVFDQYPLYNKTDSHWNELAAYYAYEYLINEIISPDFPSAKAIPISEFEIFQKKIDGGDMVVELGIDPALFKENAVFVRPKNFNFVTEYDKPLDFNLSDDFTAKQAVYYNENVSLPTMVMYRDSYSTNLYNFLPQNFSKSYYMQMHSYDIDLNLISDEQPDYLIIQCVERHIDYLFNLKGDLSR